MSAPDPGAGAAPRLHHLTATLGRIGCPGSIHHQGTDSSAPLQAVGVTRAFPPLPSSSSLSRTPTHDLWKRKGSAKRGYRWANTTPGQDTEGAAAGAGDPGTVPAPGLRGGLPVPPQCYQCSHSPGSPCTPAPRAPRLLPCPGRGCGVPGGGTSPHGTPGHGAGDAAPLQPRGTSLSPFQHPSPTGTTSG